MYSLEHFSTARLLTEHFPSLESTSSGHFYSTKVQTAVALPSKKYFVGTFHSCLLSRAYDFVVKFDASSGG